MSAVLRLSHREFALLNEYQQRFPLSLTPFAQIAEARQMDEETVLATYRRWQESGLISRIGPVFAPNRVGCSTLAALAVPEARLEAVAAVVSSYAEVNHNYEREHDWNLWFVVTAPDRARLDAVLAEISKRTGLTPMSLPMHTPYHIDLGFDLGRNTGGAAYRHTPSPKSIELPDPRFLNVLQGGLPLVERPYDALGARLGISGEAVVAGVESWLADGTVKRFGVVVRHHELGFSANAMCVWDIPDETVDDIGRQLAREPGVTLCYRRHRDAEHWPYNLYCMIHGRDRHPVRARRDTIARDLGLDCYPGLMLFSRRRFKQCGAHYRSRDEVSCHAA